MTEGTGPVPFIAPRPGSVPAGGRTVPVTEIELGETARGAVVLLAAPGELRTTAAGTMNQLAAHGFASVAAEVAAGTAADPEGGERALGVLRELLDRLGGHGWTEGQTGVVGHGAGGRAALLAATAFSVGAAVSVSPDGLAGGDLAGLAPAVRAPWLGLFPETADRTAIGRLQRGLESAPAHAEALVLPSAGPALYCDPPSPRGHAGYFEAWQRTLEWLCLRVEPRPTPLAELWDQRAALARP